MCEKDGGRLIPKLTTQGHIPPGRYWCALEDVEARFVKAREYARSLNRPVIWSGFLEYLAEWVAAESQLGVDALHSVWIAGSFISSRLEPSDIDITPVVSQEVIDSLHGQPGAKRLKNLVGHRERLRRRYHVDVFPLGWRPVTRLLAGGVHDVATRRYLEQRGALDDLWQRIGPNTPGPLALPGCHAERGLLEVAV